MGDGPRKPLCSGFLQAQPRAEIPAQRGPTPREVLLSAAGAQESSKGLLLDLCSQAPRDGLQPQQCFTLAALGAGNFLWQCESRAVVPCRQVKELPRLFLKAQRWLDSSSSWQQRVFVRSARGAEPRSCSSRLRPDEPFSDPSAAWKGAGGCSSRGRGTLWRLIPQVTPGSSQPLSQGPSGVQGKGSAGSEPCVHGRIIAVGTVFFWLLQGPVQGESQGAHGAGPAAPPCPEADEGLDGAVDGGR